METEKINDVPEKYVEKNTEKHRVDLQYYGDTLRQVYLGIAIIILITTPFLKDQASLPGIFSVGPILILALLAGLTNPKSKIVIMLDFFISSLVVICFSYVAIFSYIENSIDAFFICNLGISLLAIFAFYLSVKTLKIKMFLGVNNS